MIEALKNTVAFGHEKWFAWFGEQTSGTFPNTQFITKIFMKALGLDLRSETADTLLLYTRFGF